MPSVNCTSPHHNYSRVIKLTFATKKELRMEIATDIVHYLRLSVRLTYRERRDVNIKKVKWRL